MTNFYLIWPGNQNGDVIFQKNKGASEQLYKESMTKVYFNSLVQTTAYSAEVANLMEKYQEPVARKLALFNLLDPIKEVQN